MKALTNKSLTFNLLLIILCCILTSRELIGQPLTFDLKKLPEPTSVKLSEIGAIGIKYIPLQTSQQSLISEIRDIIFAKDYFLTQNFAEINMFRYDGSFVSKIGEIGRGPNEFTTAHDIDINPKDESIYVADGWLHKFLVFNKFGKIIRTFKTPQSGPLDFKFTDDGILCYYQNHMGITQNSYILIDTLGRILKNYPNRYPWKRTVPNVAFGGENLYYRFNGNLNKKEIYSDTIYTYKNKSFEPHLILDIGKLRLTPAKREENDYKYILNNFLNPVNLFEFGNCIYYEFIIPPAWGNEKKYSFIGSKNGKINLFFDPEKGLINDLDAGPNIWPRTVKDNSTVATWIDALDLKQHVQFKSLKPPPSQKIGKLEQLARTIKETDNPIIVLIEVK